MIHELTDVPVVPDDDSDLLIFWGTPGAEEITTFPWDTTVVQVTEPWPSIEPSSLREMMVLVTGRPDLTDYLYSLRDLDEYTRRREACKNCHDPGCQDKWCGLRGDEETKVLDVIP